MSRILSSTADRLLGAAGAQQAASRWARRLLPSWTVRLAMPEPGLSLHVDMKRHAGLWWRGLAAYEERVVALLRAAARPGDVAYDVGANIGFYTLLLSRWVAPGGTVVAFEPEPDNIALLRRNLDANSCANVTLRTSAVGAACGETAFSRDLATGASGHVGPRPTYGGQCLGDGQVRTLRVPLETLDSAPASGLPPPDIIKLDIEGGEGSALQGARGLLASHRPLVVTELSCWGEPDAGAAWMRAVEVLRDSGYRLWSLDDGGELPPGSWAWMALAIHSETARTARAGRALAALTLARPSS